jgi:hypothetical protein
MWSQIGVDQIPHVVVHQRGSHLLKFTWKKDSSGCFPIQHSKSTKKKKKKRMKVEEPREATKGS